jgi:hypothetical protein
MAYSTLPDPCPLRSPMKEDHSSNNKQDRVKFDISRLLNLQSQFRNFKTYLQLHPLETKLTGNPVPTLKISMATHSIYDLSEISTWTPEDEDAKKREVQGLEPKKKIDLFFFYNVSRFPVTVIGDENDNEANRKLMLAELKKLLKEEHQRFVNGATKVFTNKLNCHKCERAHSKCMTHPITTLLVELQIEMRQMDPMNITQTIVENWTKTFEKVHNEYMMEYKESQGICDKLVAVRHEPKETWVWITFLR